MSRLLTTAFLGVCLVFPAWAQEKTYDIKLKKDTKGDRVQVNSTDTSDVSFALEVMGQAIKKAEKKVIKNVYVEEILEKPADARKATRLTRKFEIAQSTKDGKKTDQIYQKKTVAITKKGDKYVFTVEGEELSGDDVEELESEFNKKDDIPLDDQDLMPTKPVKLNEIWIVDSKKISQAFESGGPFKLDAEKTKVTGKLTKAYVKNERQYGVIELNMSLAISELKLDGQELPMKPGSKILATTSFDICIDGSAQSGSESAKMTFDLNGEIPNGTLTVKGSVNMEKKVNDLVNK